MSTARLVRLSGLGVAMWLALAPCSAAKAQEPALSGRADTSGLTLPDTLTAYKGVRGSSPERSALIAAVVDALQGRSGLPAPLVLKSFRREGKSVIVDMVADSLPRLRFRNAGGTVRVLADGRRVILRRHN
jgi:hypothetical protein